MFKYTINDIVKIYEESALDIANMICKLNEFKSKFDRISNQTMDNADPVCEAQTCLEQLGVLLAVVEIYKHEYEEDLKKENSKE